MLLTVVLIAYGSLYPWRFRPTPSGESAVEILVRSWPDEYGLPVVKDAVVNVGIYLPLGVFALLTFAGSSRLEVAVSASLLLGFTLSVADEMAQAYIPGRFPSMLDVTTDTIGTGIGVVAGILWRRTRHRPAQRPDSVFLLCCWVVYQSFPFLPSLTHMRPVLAFRSVDALFYFAEALALVPITASLRGTPRAKRIVLGGLLLLVPLKVLIFTRQLALAEIAAAALVFIIGCSLPVNAALDAGVLAIAVLLRGLAPFDFLIRPHPFWWVPFQASFFSDWEPALIILLGKVFAYGALLWLLRESGARLFTATAATVVLLASIEVAQRYLPGRSSEITDPLLAIVLGWVFWSLGPGPAPNPYGRASWAWPLLRRR